MDAFKYAVVKFNGGRGALLCNKCHTIIKQDFDPVDIKDREYLCVLCQPRHRNDPLVAHDCAYLDGRCNCRSIQECKYG